MTLFLIGIVIFFLARNAEMYLPNFHDAKRIFRIVGISLALFGLASSSVKQIEAGEIGVQTLFGKVQARILESGLNVVNPFVEIKLFDTKTENYTMSSVSSEGDKTGDDRWYEVNVPVADRLYDEHLAELKKEGLING